MSEHELERLRRANAALLEANGELARAAFARGESGGVSTLAVLRDRVLALETERDALLARLAEREARILQLDEIARRNDALYQQERAWRDARRYRIADRVHAALTRFRRGRG
jgi:hypothetical protein